MIFWASGRRELRRYLLLAVPAIVIGPLPAIVALPSPEYGAGWFGAIATVWLLAAAYCLALLGGTFRNVLDAGVFPKIEVVKEERSQWRHRGRLWPQFYVSRSRTHGGLATVLRRRSLLGGALAVAVFVGLSVADLPGVQAVNAQDEYRQQRASLDSVNPSQVQTRVRAWNLSRGAPPGWLVEPGVRIHPTVRGLDLRTRAHDGSYQLVAPRLELVPGEYVAAVKLNVIRGGMGVGVVDLRAGEFISQSNYWSGQYGFNNRMAVTQFVLAKPTSAQVVLYNWSPSEEPSSWVVHNVALVKLKPACGCSPTKPGVWLPPDTPTPPGR
jgi:hypothetical protein